MYRIRNQMACGATTQLFRHCKSEHLPLYSDILTFILHAFDV